jgi:uncharacterized damage-inducible protein DinB
MADAPNADARVEEIMYHILGAQQIWIDRIKGRPVNVPEKFSSPEERHDRLQKLYDEYLELLSWTQPDELDGVIEYRDLKGNPWRDIIVHVCNHGTYHRGQIALLVRGGGDVPLATDYIAMIREQTN